jgi:hypothetical protein
MPVTKATRASARTKRWVEEKLNTLRNEGAERNRMILGLRKQRFLRLKPRPPEAYQEYLGQGVRVPVSFRLGETVVGAVAGGQEMVEFTATSPDTLLGQRATIWTNMQIPTQERWSQAGLYFRYWDSLINDGMAGLKTQRRPWTDFPKKGDEEEPVNFNRRVEAFLRTTPPIPYRTRVVDAATMFPSHSEWGKAYFGEMGLRPTEDTMQMLGLRPTRSGFTVLDPTEMPDEPTPLDMPGIRMGPRIQVDELWTETDLFVRIHGSVFQYENEFGRIPYEWTSGATIGFSDPTLQALSVHYPLQYLEPWINQFLSTLVAQGGNTATPTPVITHEAIGGAGSVGETQVSELEAGRLHDLPPGSDFNWKNAPLDGSSITLFNTMVDLAQRMTLSPIPEFAGTRTPGVVMSAVAERVMSVLTPKIAMAKTTWSDQQKFYMRLVREVVKAPVSVSGMVFDEGRRSRQAETVLTPKDVPKISDVLTVIRFQTVQDKIAWNTHSVMMVQSGLWSLERGMRESGVRDTEHERQQGLLDRLRASEPIQQYLMQRAISGQPPLEALQELGNQAAQQSGIGEDNALAGLLGSGGQSPVTPTGPDGGRLPAQARQPANQGAEAAAGLF